MTSQQYATFAVAGDLFGVDVRTVQEVHRFSGCTPVPLAPPGIRGLFNLRGQVIPAIDLRVRLGLRPAPNGIATMNVVVRYRDEPFGLLVDTIGEVLELDQHRLQPAPATLGPSTRRFIRGVFMLTDLLVLALDIGRAINPGQPPSGAPTEPSE